MLERAQLAAGASGRNQGLLLPGLDPPAHLLFREAVADVPDDAGGAGAPEPAEVAA